MSARPHSFRVAAPLAIGGALLLFAQVHGFLAVVLPVVPLLLLVVSLLFGMYPGCEAAARLAERIAARSRRAAEERGREPRPSWLLPRRSAHGGLLLAFSLSGRAPPA